MTGKPRTAGVYLLRKDGAALFQHRDNKPDIHYPGMWVPPGGHCDEGESAEECARRELLEETGYRCGTLLWLRTLEDTAISRPVLLTMFWTHYDGVQPVTCHEGQDLRFLARDTADRYPIPPHLIELWDAALAAAVR